MHELAIHAVLIINVVLLLYFLALNGYYAAISLFGFSVLRGHAGRMKSVYLDRLPAEGCGMPVSVIVPAYNEEASVVDSVAALLDLDYAEIEILVVNDGSTDETLARLTEAYDLVDHARARTAEIETEPVRRILHSSTNPNVWVIDKENGGKADALNAGIAHCQTPLFCAVDADTLIDRQGLVRIVRPFLEDRTTIAAGGVVRVVNGCEVQKGRVTDVRLPEGWLARLQVLEYLRAFLFGRMGWSKINSVLIVSGAFGMFRRRAVVEAGGYRRSTVSEDMELVVRLHRRARESDEEYRIVFVPDPIAWTEVPETVTGLGAQRNRWQRGLGESLLAHVGMFGRPRYGRIGLVAFPFHALFELVGPLLEITGYVAFVVAAALGVISWWYAAIFFALAVGVGTFLSISAVALQEHAIQRYDRPGDLVKLVGLAVLENLGYRQMLAWFRLRGVVDLLRGAGHWGGAERRGFAS